MVKETVYKTEQVAQIADRLRLPKQRVLDIWNMYVDYLISRVDAGESVKILNICYLRVNEKSLTKGEKVHETLAYISTEICRKLNITKEVVYRVLTSFEDYMIQDLQNFYSYSIRGLVRIRLERYGDSYKVRVKKSTRYNGLDVYVITLGTFRRKVEFGV